MNSVLVLIPLSLLFLIVAGILFFWASNHGQFDDMDSPGLLPMSDNLPDEDDTNTSATNNNPNISAKRDADDN